MRRAEGRPAGSRTEDAAIFDSHAHVSSARFDGDRQSVLARAWEAGLTGLFEVGAGLASSRAAIALARTDARIRATVGIHPHHAATADEDALVELAELARDPDVVAIGECGLDRGPHNQAPLEAQTRLLRAHLALARSRGLPLVFHVRDAFPEFFEIVDADVAESGPLRGIMHCFSAGPEEARRSVALGLHVSFSGIVTFPNAPRVREAVRSTPLDRILVETDCPYLAPEPHRGQRNEPAYVIHTATCVARLAGLEPSAFAERVRSNTLTAYGLSEEDPS